MSNEIKQIREIKEILGVDILCFTVKFAGMKSEDIQKMETILYSDNVPFDIKVDDAIIILENVIKNVKRKHTDIGWEISDLHQQLRSKKGVRDKLAEIIGME
ncbi:hypothetical protein [Mammaliicoccus vitulinus]|uniref:hypothetical protein n=1 Tax=Mammaliicoccus vitulinus TaxID=71237 RepID=UPI003F9BD1F3